MDKNLGSAEESVTRVAPAYTNYGKNIIYLSSIQYIYMHTCMYGIMEQV